MNCSLCNLTNGVVLESTYWTLALNDNQATLGRVFFSLKRHETDITALTPDELEALWTFVTEAKSALATLFAPDHYNYMFLMNLTPHVHFHIFPRYREPRVFADQTFWDTRFGGHYDPDEDHPLDPVTRDALAAVLRHELTRIPSTREPA